MSLVDMGLRARVVICNINKKCGGVPYIPQTDEPLDEEETPNYKKGCNTCGGTGVQVLFEPPHSGYMKFTDKDVRFYESYMDRLESLEND